MLWGTYINSRIQLLLWSKVLKPSIDSHTVGFPEVARKRYILKLDTSSEKWCNLGCRVSCVTTTDTRHKKSLFRVSLGVVCKSIDSIDKQFQATCGRDSIALTLNAFTLSHHCAKSTFCHAGCSAIMISVNAAAEDEDFVGTECLDDFGSHSVAVVFVGKRA